MAPPHGNHEDLISSPSDAVFERVWKLVQEIGIQERHFNTLQVQYRSMASLWLLSSFGAIGFMLSQGLRLDLSREFLVSCICLFGAVGISLLWILDIMVYHRLLDSCFIEGMALEELYAWLPPIRTNMMKAQQGQGVLFRTAAFYMLPISLLLLISAFSLARSCYLAGAQLASILIGFGGILISVLAAAVVVKKTENTRLFIRNLNLM